MRVFKIILLYLFFSSPVTAQFSLLKDVNPGSGSNNGNFLRYLKPGVWVTGWNGGASYGEELWRTDGTTAGTTMIKDLNPGSGWGVGYSNNPYGVIFKNELYIGGTENGGLMGLYKTDGTAAGTVKVTSTVMPYDISIIDSTLYLAGYTDQYGIELYKSDGTTTGTTLVKDIWPGTNRGLKPASNYRNDFFVKANNLVFFRANDGVHGYELWRTDGTAAGTQMVKDIFPGSGNGLPSSYDDFLAGQYLIAWKDNLYFVAQGNSGTEQLWRTDGTEAGTVQISNFSTTGTMPFTTQIIQLGNYLYFMYRVADGTLKLVRSDGTAAGTEIIPTPVFNSTSLYLAKGYSLFYFSMFSAATGTELWRSDGTAAGTFMIKDLNPGSGYGMFALTSGNSFVNWDDIYFSGDNGQTGTEIYKSDGSPGNISLVFDAYPGSTGSSPFVYSNVGGRLSAKLTTPVYGEENWISDLPVLFPDLLNFTGVADYNAAKLNWTTRNEDNAVSFDLERSTDSVTFTHIAQIPAAGASHPEGNYNYTDPGLSPRVYYYRLKLNTNAGAFKVSNVVRIEIKSGPPPAGGQFVVYPNPASGLVQVMVSPVSSVNDELVLTDMAGRLIRRQQIPVSASGQTIKFSLWGLATGVYQVSRLTDGLRVNTAKLIVH